MEKIEKSNNPAWAIIGWTFIFSIGYAILRYHIFGPVPWKDFPFFILNKGISLSAFILLTFNFTFGPLKNLGVPVPNSWLRSRRFVGIIGFLQVFIHVLMSFMLFNPSNYAKFFLDHKPLAVSVIIFNPVDQTVLGIHHGELISRLNVILSLL